MSPVATLQASIQKDLVAIKSLSLSVNEAAARGAVADVLDASAELMAVSIGIVGKLGALKALGVANA